MPESGRIERAELLELDSEHRNEVPGGHSVRVQFNPESLKLSFANQIQTSAGAGDQTGTPARQYVGAGTTKLALQLWFDVTASAEHADAAADAGGDVRNLTRKVAWFITPVETADHKFVPPGVRFRWGSFQFDGLVESLEESLEFFSGEGRPLRASVSLVISQQKISDLPAVGAAGAGGASPGTRPLTAAPAGASLQQLAAGKGQGDDWQAIAAANAIENPRMLAPGQLVDLSARKRTR